MTKQALHSLLLSAEQGSKAENLCGSWLSNEPQKLPPPQKKKKNDPSLGISEASKNKTTWYSEPNPFKSPTNKALA